MHDHQHVYISHTHPWLAHQSRLTCTPAIAHSTHEYHVGCGMRREGAESPGGWSQGHAYGAMIITACPACMGLHEGMHGVVCEALVRIYSNRLRASHCRTKMQLSSVQHSTMQHRTVQHALAVCTVYLCRPVLHYYLRLRARC